MTAVVDTGFNGFLTLAPLTVSRLGLPVRAPTLATLADGTQVQLDVFEATVLWDGRRRILPILEAVGGSLVGMSMLRGYRLVVDVVDGGAVTIALLP